MRDDRGDDLLSVGLVRLVAAVEPGQRPAIDQL
jgi:hypothetical protein